MKKTIEEITYDLSSSLNPFQLQQHVHLINWKWKNITTEKGVIAKGGKEYYLDVLFSSSRVQGFFLCGREWRLMRLIRI